MSKNVTMDDAWKECPTGTLNELASRDRRMQRRNFLLRVCGAGGTIGAGLLGVLYLNGDGLSFPNVDNAGDKDYGGIRCSKVKELGRSYVQGQLSSSMLTKMEVHLESCPFCKAYIESIRSAIEREG